MTAHVGQTVTLPCNTTLNKNVDWRQTSPLRGLYVYSNDVMYDDFRYRFSVDRSIPGFYNLTITNVQLNDSARYICIEDMGQGTKHYHTLNVTGLYIVIIDCITLIVAFLNKHITFIAFQLIFLVLLNIAHYYDPPL